MPQRFLRPGITTSDRWNAVSFEAQSFYIRILTLVDDFGRFDGRVPILHGQCFALRPEISLKRSAALRSELHDAELIQVYEAGGKDFIQVERWSERARCERSKFPDPPSREQSAAESCGPLPSASSLAITSSPVHPRSSPLLPDTASAAFRSRFEEWVSFRKGLGKKPKDWDAMFREQLLWLAVFDEGTAIEIMSQSIRNGWQGLFELKSGAGGVKRNGLYKEDFSHLQPG